jgi:GcrA cell cycle regulator
MEWTVERVTALSKLWRDGLTATQIAKQLGGVSRCAVSGKVRRLRLLRREMPSSPTATTGQSKRKVQLVRDPGLRPARRLVQSKPAYAPPQPTTQTRYVFEVPATATIHTLSQHGCKWPIGEPDRQDFGFCGRRSEDVSPYCVNHARMAYAVPQDKKKNAVAELTRSLRRYI